MTRLAGGACRSLTLAVALVPAYSQLTPASVPPKGSVRPAADTELRLPAASSSVLPAASANWPSGAVNTPACTMWSARSVNCPPADSTAPGALPLGWICSRPPTWGDVSPVAWRCCTATVNCDSVVGTTCAAVTSTSPVLVRLPRSCAPPATRALPICRPVRRRSSLAARVLLAVPLMVKSPYTSMLRPSTRSVPLPLRVATVCEGSAFSSAPPTAGRWPKGLASTTLLARSSAVPGEPDEFKSSSAVSTRTPRANSSLGAPRSSMRSSACRRSLSKPPAVRVFTSMAAGTLSAAGVCAPAGACVTTSLRARAALSGKSRVLSRLPSSKAKLPPAVLAVGARPLSRPFSSTPSSACTNTEPAALATSVGRVGAPTPSPATSSVCARPSTDTTDPASTNTRALRASSRTAPPALTLPCRMPASLGRATNVPSASTWAAGPRRSVFSAWAAGPSTFSVMLPPAAWMRPFTSSPAVPVRVTLPPTPALMAAPSSTRSTALACWRSVVRSVMLTGRRWSAGRRAVRAMSASRPPEGSATAAACATCHDSTVGSISEPLATVRPRAPVKLKRWKPNRSKPSVANR